ncbi:hypothetical protein HYALB_00007947 [Hymenoscyphus albidus]|uniref:WD40 repeat-like protein n=1 Tax=Hymenoscyphus albidus TaxID=595503 RepID=A0A9N9LMK4_9HELO|nr:hypothetical protein HYALB_00007947 [Hymenoscyphus albidus]
MDSIVYAHTLSPIANHLLVACATQNPVVRLVDLRSGANTHSLPGHAGALLSLAWNPTVEHVLASGGVDGTLRLWNIRRSTGPLGILDMEDCRGIGAAGGAPRYRLSAKSHHSAVNGITWTGDGSFIISAGHDERVRVWNAANGANTLASFGPTLRNGHMSTLPLVLSPSGSTDLKRDLLFYPNQRDLLMFELHQGKLLKRLRVPGPVDATVRSRTGERIVRNRITALAWKGQSDGIFSAHTDGQIRAWCPRTEEDDDLDAEENDSKRPNDDNYDDNSNTQGKRKRQVLENVYRDLTRQRVTFG